MHMYDFKKQVLEVFINMAGEEVDRKSRIVY